MENQHQQIKGYRDLSQNEIDRMNEIKSLAETVGDLVERMTVPPGHQVENPVDQRWVSIGKTHLQQGFMALTRAIAKPTSF